VGNFYICNVVGSNDHGPVAALERPLPLLAPQRLSTTFNVGSTNDVKNALNDYPQLPSEPPLKGGRRVASGGSRAALSEA